MSKVIESLERAQLRGDLPQFKAGDTVRVHFKVIEGQRQRIQVFEGIVLKKQRVGLARELHRPQAVLRRRSRAHLPPAYAQDRADRGRPDRRRRTGPALLPSGQAGQEARIRELRQDGARGAKTAVVEPEAEVVEEPEAQAVEEPEAAEQPEAAAETEVAESDVSEEPADEVPKSPPDRRLSSRAWRPAPARSS